MRICPKCGFANDPATVLKRNKHETKYKKTCGNTSMEFVSLGHEFSTDIMKVSLPSHNIDLKMPEGTQPKDQYLSTLYAILEGASSALDISRNDINGCVTSSNEIILYDDTAGGSGFVKHIYKNFESVLREARNKVSGTCGCTEETSCYGCLRNYSNQFYHDEISRGLAYHYIDWLLNMEDIPSSSVTPEPDTFEDDYIMGIKKSNYEAPDTSSFDDTETALKQLIEESTDLSFSEGLQKLLSYVKGKNFENPITDDVISVESNIWPELFWGKSQVAVFSKENESQYHILKKYDWYCYVIDEKVDPEKVFKHIKHRE